MVGVLSADSYCKQSGHRPDKGKMRRIGHKASARRDLGKEACQIAPREFHGAGA